MSHNILLGVTGGIAAYKSPELVRRLRELGANVQVVMTAGAAEFITPLSLQAVSGQPVRSELFDLAAEAAMGHIELARWPDAILIAPATADCMAKLAAGLSGDLLSTLCLATDKPIYLAPAMNRLMWSNAATQANVNVLKSRGFKFFGPADGEQACGEIGAGRMVEPLDLAQHLYSALGFTDNSAANSADSSTNVMPNVAQVHDQARDVKNTLDGKLAGKHVVITAGPTVEPIDPVRYISNHSSGKMGYAIAAAATAAGAKVTLISGPTQLEPPLGVDRIDVQTAQDMLTAVQCTMDACDVFIATAAVADYKMAQTADKKIKKTADTMNLALTKNPDILAAVASEHPQVFTVGFAAETDNVLQYARDKLARKKIDMIAANDVSNGQVFGQDNNQLTVVWADGECLLPSNSKTQLGHQLVDLIGEQYLNE